MYPHLGHVDDLTATIVGWVATGATVYLFASPLLTMRHIYLAGSTMAFSDVPYVVAFMNCGLWMSYAAMTPNRLQPLVCNVFGFSMQVLYVLVFLRYHPRSSKLLLLGKMALATVALTVLISAALKLHWGGNESAASNLCGIGGDTINIMMYASPLAVVRDVVKTKSVQFMPFQLSLATLIVSMLWAFFAIWIGDIFIGIPNNIGLLLGSLQLCIYFKYSSCAEVCQPLTQRAGPGPVIDLQPGCA